MPGRLKSSPSPSGEMTPASTPPPASSISSPTLTAATTPPSSAPRSPRFPVPAPIQRPVPSTLERARQTLIRNRRLHWLSKNPTYFTSPDLELADPLLYDRLIRQYLTPAEREAQGRARGWSGVLEVDLTRAEAKVAALAEADTGVSVEARAETAWGDVVSTKEEGEELWREAMTLRFLRGGDEDVDYRAIDESEEWDDRETERREAEERWFDAETPSETSGDTGVLDY